MREVKASLPDAGITASGEQLSNIRYADDTTLLENSKEGMEHLAEAVKDESEKFGLKINDSKTNVMVMNGVGKVELDGTELETVNQFKYLGSII